MTLFYSFVPDIYDLINYTAFSEAIFVTLCVCALLWLRYTRPEMPRPIRVPTLLPLVFLVICLFLVLFPVYASPRETGLSLLITLSGIPLYFLTVSWHTKPRFYRRGIRESRCPRTMRLTPVSLSLSFSRSGALTCLLQRLLLSVEEEREPTAKHT